MVNVAEQDRYAVPDLSATPGNRELACDNQDVLLCVRLDKELPLPIRAHPHDAGIDLYSAENVTINPGQRVLVSTGIAIGLPQGTVGLIHPRSGLAYKHGLSIVNSPGTIDEGYQGEIKVCLINLDHRESIMISRGDRIAQLIIQKVELPPIVEIAAFSQTTARGNNGYGSTGGHESLAVHQEISSGYQC